MHERQAERALDDMEMVTGIRLRPRRPAPRPPVVLSGATLNHIHVNNSTVGIVNTGDLQQVDSAVSAIAGAGDQQLAAAFKSLTEIVLSQPGIDAERKKEAVEILSALASEGAADSKSRRPGVVKPLLNRLREILAVSADIVSLAQPALQVVAAAFG